MNKLQRIVDLCACEVFLIVNGHTTDYATVREHLTQLSDTDENLSENEFKELIKATTESGTLVHLMFYPHTPIGSHTVYAASIEEAFDRALEILEE